MDESKSPIQESNHSGLDFIWHPANPLHIGARDAAYDFATQALANSATHGRYWQAERLTLWQAFALFCYLDPDVLGAPTPARLDYLAQVVRWLRPQDPLARFWHNLHLIQVVQLSPRQTGIQGFTSVTDVRRFRDHLTSIGFKVEPPAGKLYDLLLPDTSDRLRQAAEVWLKEWRPREYGATQTDPCNGELKLVLIKRGCSGFLAQAIARVVRPLNASRGRCKGAVAAEEAAGSRPAGCEALLRGVEKPRKNRSHSNLPGIKASDFHLFRDASPCVNRQHATARTMNNALPPSPPSNSAAGQTKTRPGALGRVAAPATRAEKNGQKILTRDLLYSWVWHQPASHVAKELGISDTALRKRCEKYDIPRPGRGYWAEKTVGIDSRAVVPLPRPEWNPEVSFRVSAERFDMLERLHWVEGTGPKSAPTERVAKVSKPTSVDAPSSQQVPSETTESNQSSEVRQRAMPRLTLHTRSPSGASPETD